MANLVTHALTYSRENVMEYFITPLFIDNPEILQLMTIRTDIKTSDKLDFFSPLENITKGYAQGASFTSSTGVTYTQKTITVADMKAEVQQNGKAFLNSVKQSMLAKGVDENDLAEGTLLHQIIAEIFRDGLRRDLIRQAFLGDTVKETMVATGSLYSPTGTLDVNYKEYKGFWPRIIDDFDAAVIDASQRVNINVVTTYQTVAAVAAVKTSTLTGTSGTANITINGVAYLATFTTDLTTSAANFVTSHAATILARHGKCVVTSSGADVIVTSGLPGMNVTVSAPVNVSGNLAGSVATTTAAVKNTTLVAGAGKTILQAMYEAMPNELAEFEDSGSLRYMVSKSIYNNYLAYLQTQSGAEAAFSVLVDGVKTLTYNGIPLIKRADWDTRVSTTAATTYGGVRPHRALLTVPKNLVLGVDGEADSVNVESFYDQTLQVRFFRTEYKSGTQYVHPLYIVAAY